MWDILIGFKGGGKRDMADGEMTSCLFHPVLGYALIRLQDLSSLWKSIKYLREVLPCHLTHLGLERGWASPLKGHLTDALDREVMNGTFSKVQGFLVMYDPMVGRVTSIASISTISLRTGILPWHVGDMLLKDMLRE